MRLLLVRHGQTPANVRGALDTAHPGLGLTDLGKTQAEAVPGALADEDVVALYASPLVRTQLTAGPLAAALGLEVQVRAGLEEISAGTYEMRSDPEAVEGYVGCLAAWMGGDLDRAMPAGPDGRAFLARYTGALDAIAAEHPDATVVVVSHGAAIRVFTTIAAGLGLAEAERLSIDNTGMAVLEGSPATGWRLARWTGHPLGGAHLSGRSAADVTGESVDAVEDD